MLEFLKRRKFKKEVLLLETALLEKLSEHFPDLAENHQYWTLVEAYHTQGDEKIIQLTHQSADASYRTKNRIRHKKTFQIEGVQIFHKRQNQSVSMPLTVYENLISCIELPFESNIGREFDLKNISIVNLRTKDLQFENPDEKLVREILKKIPAEQLQLLEIEDSFEIILENNFYYSIVDMEDRNYIAIDKKGSVYRLVHDHETPARKIAQDVTALIVDYSGNKKDLEKFMID